MLSLSPLLNPISLSSPIVPHQTHHLHGPPFPFKFKPLTFPAKPLIPKIRPNSTLPTNTIQQEEEKEEDFQVLTATRTEFNDIVILESQNAKVLLLDDSGNVHSILYKGQKWTNSYWDEFTSLPAIIPHGPVAIFGLGGGTVAHQLFDVWPSLCIEGWELDEVLVDRTRQFFGLSELEMGNESGGFLRIRVGDALSSLASVEGGYAGIAVDLFSDAKVLPQLEKVETWLEMKEKLMPNGRIMVNCGGANLNCHAEKEWEVNLTIKALCGAFGGKFVNWKKMPENESGNYLALTGPLPDLVTWSGSVPEKLSLAVQQWRPCD